jgi:hypothetical protein
MAEKADVRMGSWESIYWEETCLLGIGGII